MLIAFCKDSFYCANFISGVKKFKPKSITKLLSNVFINLICSLVINYNELNDIKQQMMHSDCWGFFRFIP